MENLITKHIDIWTSAQTPKTNGAGRGNGSAKSSLYGIKKLRELILELAVRGKLVPQNPKDESASVLLEKIAKEKARLIKEGKIKKEKPLQEISEDEKPFELPSSWSWTRLGNITNYGISDKVEPGQVSESTWILELEDVEKGTSKLLQKIRCNVRKFQSSKNKFNKGDVIYGKLRPYLDKVIIANEDGVCTTEMIPLKSYKCLTPQFLRLVMKSPYFIHYADESTHGMNLPRLGTDKARLALFPLVCEHLQHRIVAKVDELTTLCDKLEQQQSDSNTAHETLVETLLASFTSAADANEFDEAWQSIADNFDVLFTDEQSIDQLKQTILQLAVMGKLVPQNPKDEPASVLLKNITSEKACLIKEGKIKKEKSLPEISEDEKTYNLPKSWEWARLTDVYYSISPSGKTLKSSETVEKGSYPVVDQGKSYIAGYTENANLLIKIPGPVIIFGDHTMEMKYINFNFVAGADGTKILRPYKMDERYFYIYLLSYKLENKGYARHFKVLNDNLIALPPLLEQHRIVAKIDELMAVCDKLKARLKEAQTTQIHLADAILKQAVG